MKVKKYGKQGFFNTVDSDDDGSFKFSIRPAVGAPERPNIFFQIRDCTGSINLDLDTGYSSDELNFAKQRLKKIRKMRRVLDEFLGHAEKAMLRYIGHLEKKSDR